MKAAKLTQLAWILGSILVLVGVGPLLYLLWFGASHNFEPLSMPLPLKQGQYTSPEFKTDLDDTYQIDLNLDGMFVNQMNVHLFWKVVDNHGAVLAQGEYRNLYGGNSAHLGFYRSKRGVRQRLVLTLPEDTQGMNNARARLSIGDPEQTLDMAYGSAAFLGWAVVIAGPGLILLLIALFRQLSQRHSIAAAP
jgi:hypothetical protein